MRKVLSWFVLFLGAFLLVAGLVAEFWAEDAARKTPLEVDTTTYLTGTAETLDPASGDLELRDVQATSITESDTEASDEEVVVFVNTTCLVVAEGEVPDCVDADDPQERLISASTDVFATDRETALAVNDDTYLPPDAEPHEGLINKWPFGTRQEDYEYWDGILNEAVPAVFDGVEEIEGLETYRFQVTVEEEPAEVVSTVDGLYSTDKTIWIEPETGAIIKQTQDELRTLPNGDPLLDLDIEFTEDQVSANVQEAEDNKRSLWLVSTLVPVVGIVGGLILLAAGGVLLVLGSRRRREDAY